jgi:hypothetical protein
MHGGSRFGGEKGAGATSTPSAKALSVMKLWNIVYSPVGALEQLFNLGDELIVVARKNKSH